MKMTKFGISTLFVEYLPFLVSLVYIVVCPYNKVEESFNMQACHDILHHGWNLENYDHHDFPGVVPRTFIGALFVSFFAYPMIWVANMFQGPKIISQFVVRSVLSLTVLTCFQKFRNAIYKKFGIETSIWYTLIVISQFHFMFYVSRPLPNTFALAISLYALYHWLEGNVFRFIFWSAAGILIFRGELAIFLGLFLIMDLIAGRIRFLQAFAYGIISLVVCLSLTVTIDSVFWNRTLWPEGEVLYYNVILNKSSDWGTSPWGWYFYSALPRALFTSLPLVPLGVLLDTRRRRTLIFLLPCLLFVTAYSFLPHKELRFIFYVIPVLNLVAAEACKTIWINRQKSCFRKLLALGVCLHLVVNLLFSSFMLVISNQNYPGGLALMQLHSTEPPLSQVRVHIDVYAAQTGISRFTELNKNWVYDKTENLTHAELSSDRFTHLLVEDSASTLELQNVLKATHVVWGEIDAFDKLEVDFKKFPPLAIKLRRAIIIYKKFSNS